MTDHTKDFGGGIMVRARGDRPGRRVHKQYVDVYARANADGTMVPIRVCWPDGRCFTIDQILEIEPFGAIVQNAQTATYTVRFGQWRTQLMLEHYHEEDDIHGAEDHFLVNINRPPALVGLGVRQHPHQERRGGVGPSPERKRRTSKSLCPPNVPFKKVTSARQGQNAAYQNRSSNRLQCEVAGNAYAVPFRFKTSLRAFRATWGSFYHVAEQPPNVKNVR